MNNVNCESWNSMSFYVCIRQHDRLHTPVAVNSNITQMILNLIKELYLINEDDEYINSDAKYDDINNSDVNDTNENIMMIWITKCYW